MFQESHCQKTILVVLLARFVCKEEVKYLYVKKSSIVVSQKICSANCIAVLLL